MPTRFVVATFRKRTLRTPRCLGRELDPFQQDAPDQGTDVPQRVEVVVCTPDREDQSRQPRQVAKQDAAAVVGSHWREPTMTELGTSAAEMTLEWESNDVNRNETVWDLQLTR